MLLIGSLSIFVFLVGSALYFGSQSKWSGFGGFLVTGSTAGICVAFATHLVRLLPR